MANKKDADNSPVRQAIKEAEKLLPGIPAPDDEPDPRWQAIIEVGEFIETEPHEVWNFILKWGKHPCDDVRSAVATCLLEHLLEYHFKKYFSRVRKVCQRNKYFADTFLNCWQFGQSEELKNSKTFNALKRELG